LVSLYSPDAHSARAAHIVRRLNPVVLLTPLGELELANALELRLFRKEANPTAIHTAQTMIHEHVQAGFFSLQGMPMTAYERARRMTRRHSAQLGTRTLDILHVTSAIELGAERFLTFDERQRKLAQVEGLRVG